MKRCYLILFVACYFLLGLVGVYIFLERQDVTLYTSINPYQFKVKRLKPVNLDKQLTDYKEQLAAQVSKSEAPELIAKLQASVGSLRQIGWSDASIYHAYLAPLERKKGIDKLDQDLKSLEEATHKLGSPAYNRLLDGELAWMRQEKSKQARFSNRQKRASHLLTLVLRTLDMPANLSGNPAETRRLLEHFDKDLEPDSLYWRQLALWVQYAFPQGLAWASDFERQIHQLRYVISAQQVAYVRQHYKQKSGTDAQALAAYVSKLDESNTLLEKLGVDKADYYYDYSSSESARLHNKLPLKDLKDSPSKEASQQHIQFKLVMHFHSEFILDEKGHFVNELDNQAVSENGIVNGASFNYARTNLQSHQHLDVRPVKKLDPPFRAKLLKAYKVPNNLRRKSLENAREKWAESYFNAQGYFAYEGKSRYQAVKDQVDRFKKLVSSLNG